MKLAVMQPYFFPYLGYFALIAAVDEWIVFDVTQYTRKSWINRNRVLRPGGGWQYISMPLKNSSIHIRISEAEVAGLPDQERYVLGKISHYRKRAPYYAQVCEIVRNVFADAAGDSLVSLNVSSLRTVCKYLGLPFRYRICSQLCLDLPAQLHPGGWAPWIAGKLSADTYVNPIGGHVLFDPAEFARHGVALRFLEFAPFVYETPGYSFESNLSILDVLMWNSPDIIVRAIHDHSALISVAEQSGRIATNDTSP
jgi:WbqC-like protein family